MQKNGIKANQEFAELKMFPLRSGTSFAHRSTGYSANKSIVRFPTYRLLNGLRMFKIVKTISTNLFCQSRWLTRIHGGTFGEFGSFSKLLLLWFKFSESRRRDPARWAPTTLHGPLMALLRKLRPGRFRTIKCIRGKLAVRALRTHRESSKDAFGRFIPPNETVSTNDNESFILKIHMKNWRKCFISILHEHVFTQSQLFISLSHNLPARNRDTQELRARWKLFKQSFIHLNVYRAAKWS